MADQVLKIMNNSLGEVHFQSIDFLAKFADMNARRVSNTLELLSRGDHPSDQLQDALALLTDIAFQVAGAVEILADAVGSKGGADHG